ncbi:MAG: hypothetical protein AAFZ07_25935 [Actinomycetota bacterium]
MVRALTPPGRLGLLGLTLVLLAAACGIDDEPGSIADGSSSGPSIETPGTSAVATAAPPPVTTSPPTSSTAVGTSSAAKPGEPQPGCVHGWTVPSPGSTTRLAPLDLIRSELGVDDRFVVDEMRYFVGPDDPAIVAPVADEVRRWYVRLVSELDPGLAGRFLVIQRLADGRELGSGVLAVAPYGTAGLEPGQWISFVGEGPETTFPEVPGRWTGLPVDFVTGQAWGTDDLVEAERFGLPDDVVGCLDGI